MTLFLSHQLATLGGSGESRRRRREQKDKKKREKGSIVYSEYFGRKRRQRLPRFASFISLDIHIKSRARAHRFHEKVHSFFFSFLLFT